MSNEPEHSISVVIPAYYSYTTIEKSLEALMRQTYREFEVIVVNSSPEKNTGRIVREKFPGVKFIQSSGRLLPHAARNVGVDASRGNLLVFTDPDCIADPDWLEILAAAFNGGKKVLVGSMGLSGDGWLEKGIHLCKFHWLLPGLGPAVKTCAPTANALYSRDIWEEIGPFSSEVFAGDGILSWKASQLDHAPFFVPEAVVRHIHKETWGSFCRQRFFRGREYAGVRVGLMGKPTLLTWLSLAFSWGSLGLVLLRAGRNAVIAGWGKTFWCTLPVQITGHFSWALGESVGAALHLLGSRSIRGSSE